jgi:hypothetical protein
VDGGDNRRLLREHNVLRRIRIAGVGQKTPVDVGAITDVRVVVLGSGCLKYTLHQTLSLLGPLEEEFDNRGKNLQLGRREFFIESINKASQDVARIADLLGVLSNNPDECSSGIWFIQLVNALAKGGDDPFVARVFPENVLDDNNRFLNDVVHLGVDKVQQCINATLASALNLDSDLSNGPDGSADKVHIDFEGIFLQFSQELVHIAVVCYAHHNLKLLELDIWGVIVFAEKDTELLLENIGLLLQQKVNISQCHILHFGSRRNQGDYQR